MGQPEAKVERRETIEDAIRSAMNEILDNRDGWTKTRLAKETGEHVNSVWRWLSGKTAMPAWFVGKFCQALEVDAGSVVAARDARAVQLDVQRALHDTGSLLARVSHELQQGRIPEVADRATTPRGETG